MTTRKQAMHEARRRAARKGRLSGGIRTPELVVNCGRCIDGQGRPRFVERFRWDRLEARWVATAQTPEVPLTADDRVTADPLGWDGFRDWLQYDPAMIRWLESAQTPEGHLTSEGFPADTYGWDADVAVRFVWALRCPHCGDSCPARDENLQAVVWRMVLARQVAGRSPRKLPSLTLDQLRRELSGVPEPPH
jgi:hypothetical protein